MRRALDGIGKSRRLAVLRSVDGVSALQQRRELVQDIYASRVGCRGAGHEQAGGNELGRVSEGTHGEVLGSVLVPVDASWRSQGEGGRQISYVRLERNSAWWGGYTGVTRGLREQKSRSRGGRRSDTRRRRGHAPARVGAVSLAFSEENRLR